MKNSGMNRKKVKITPLGWVLAVVGMIVAVITYIFIPPLLNLTNIIWIIVVGIIWIHIIMGIFTAIIMKFCKQNEPLSPSPPSSPPI